MPLHRHLVSLDFLRVDFGIQYSIADNWKAMLSIPYAIKNQDASVEEIEPTSPAERRAILANQNIHHRDETYRGFSDFGLQLSHIRHSIWRAGDRFVASLGTSIPIGKTEDDPFKRGDAGRKHLHIQFGTGTFNPLAEVHYRAPLFGDLSMGTAISGQFPFYENSKTYRGSMEVTSTAEVKYQLFDWLAFHTTYLGFYQSYAYWDSERDINSGLVLNAGLFGATLNTTYGMPVRLSVMLPFHGRTLSAEGDAFDPGPTVSLTTSRSF